MLEIDGPSLPLLRSLRTLPRWSQIRTISLTIRWERLSVSAAILSRIAWSPLPLTVVYSAGYATTPADVEDAVIRMVVKRYQAKGRDPSLKSENLPGVRDVTYWIATGTESGNMTPDITDILDGYRVPLAA
jgi:hypothetical protein